MRPASWQQQFARDSADLVAVIPRRIDFDHVRDGHWYRIPERSAPAELASMAWVAFYLPAVFGPEKWSVRYWAPVREVRTARRRDLLPEEAGHPRADELYHRLTLGDLQVRPEPIFSRRRRRIVFIPSVWHKFVTALEINDLHHGSPLEDRLWAAFKQEGIEAERQWFEGKGETTYCLDFALFCPQGNIDVECDGDTWHANPAQARLDNDRNNYLEKHGWHVLRFSGAQINGHLDNCVRDVRATINRCGGLFLADGTLREFGSDGAVLLPPRDSSRTLSSVPPHRVADQLPAGDQPLAASTGLDLESRLKLRQGKERRAALASLRARYGVAAVRHALTDALTSLSPDTRGRVVWCLGELPADPATIALLAASLPADPCGKVRSLTYAAFARFRNRTVEEVILPRLGEEDEQALESALRALKVCGSRKAVGPLLHLLARPHPSKTARIARAALRCCASR
jgi:very-short-patch-repair endonuclease